MPPFLFAAAAILYTYLRAAVVSPWTDVPWLFLLDFSLILAGCYLLRRFTHDWYRTSLFLTIGVFGLLTQQTFFFLAGGGVVLTLALAYLTLKGLRKPFSPPLLNFLLTATALAAIAAVVWVFARVPGSFASPAPQTRHRLPAAWEPPPSTQNLPDIYYIILDGYGRADVLQALYHYDNRAFITALQQQGFVVVPHSQANYPRTALSLPSSLNMDYVQNFLPPMEDSPFWWRVKPFITDSQTWEILKQAGYTSVALASDWEITNNTQAEHYLHPKPLHILGVQAYYLETTPLKIFTPLLAPVAFLPSNANHRALINDTFDTLANLPATTQPKFVFAHIIAPHPPFVFDAEGRPRDPGYAFTFNDGNNFPQSKTAYREAYVAQLQYINQRVETLVKQIQAHATRPTVIILQSDHGPGLDTDFSSIQNTCLWERFSNFLALYLPGVPPQAIPDDLNAVNIFRLVLNTYLGTDFPLLENHQYYPTNPGYIFRLEEVTTDIRPTCP